MYKGILEIFGYSKWRFLEGFKVLMVVVQKCDVCTCRDNCQQSVNLFAGNFLSRRKICIDFKNCSDKWMRLMLGFNCDVYLIVTSKV